MRGNIPQINQLANPRDDAASKYASCSVIRTQKSQKLREGVSRVDEANMLMPYSEKKSQLAPGHRLSLKWIGNGR